MTQKVEIETVIYTWVRHVGIQQIPMGENADEESFIRGAHVFAEKLHTTIPEEENEKCHI